MSVVFFDLETAGLSIEHSIIQIAGIAVDENWKELETFEQKIQFDESKADPEALRINHYSAERWAPSVPGAQAVVNFKNFLERHRTERMIGKSGRPYTVALVGGHNIAGFDLDRLSRLFKTHGQFLPVKYSAPLDTLSGAAWFFFGKKEKPADSKLGTLRQWFQIPNEKVFPKAACAVHAQSFCALCGAHEALADVRTSIEVAKRFLERFTQ